MYLCVCICIYVCVCIFIYLCVYMYVCICIYVCVYMYMQMNGFIIFLGPFPILEYHEYYGCRIPRISRMGQSMPIYSYIYFDLLFSTVRQHFKMQGLLGHFGCLKNVHISFFLSYLAQVVTV
mgnify:CR=1 FL=1